MCIIHYQIFGKNLYGNNKIDIRKTEKLNNDYDLNNNNAFTFNKNIDLHISYEIYDKNSVVQFNFYIKKFYYILLFISI